MHAFSTLFAVVVVASTAIPALASKCYSKGGCKSCESWDTIYSARQSFCGSDKWSYQNSESWGNAEITLTGHFSSQQACWDGFQQIIQQCYGHKNGGSYEWNYDGSSAHLDVAFCSCR